MKNIVQGLKTISILDLLLLLAGTGISAASFATVMPYFGRPYTWEPLNSIGGFLTAVLMMAVRRAYPIRKRAAK